MITYLPEGNISQAADVVRAVVAAEFVAPSFGDHRPHPMSSGWHEGEIRDCHAPIPTRQPARNVRLHEN